MRSDEVRPYYDILKEKSNEILFLKKINGFIGGLILLVLLAIPMAVIAVWIKV